MSDEVKIKLLAALKRAGDRGLSCVELAAAARDFYPDWGNDARYGGRLGKALEREGLARSSRKNPKQLRWFLKG